MASSSSEGARIDPADHHDPDWHVHDIVSDFELIDAWRLPVSGTADEFADFCEMFVSLDLAHDQGSPASRFLFTARDKLGEVFGWDEEVLTQPIPGSVDVSLRARLSEELASTVDAIGNEESPFQTVYYTDREFMLELSNSTVHAAIHHAWVSADGDSFVGQMGIYVKNRGRLGKIYMPAIAPFRHYVVYPALMKRIDSEWRKRGE